MIIELGHMALILALLAALAQCVAPAIGAERRWADLMRVGDTAARVQFALVALSFAALAYAFLTSDFSVTLAYQHSAVDKPLAYKFAGVWGNHEGSMLLWALMLALFGALVSFFGRNLPISLRARVLSVQGTISLAFLAFILFTSNPFLRWPEGMPADYLRNLVLAHASLPGVDALLPRLGFMDENALLEIVRRYGDAIRLPLDGNDLTPVLQDPALVAHPPMLYVGYVGLSIAYSFAVAALWEGRVDAAWARWVRPWTLFAWVALTLGIALGSYWAYYEIGWGGWWFWDPVENASFMPWLAATALLHSAVVVEKRGELKSWTTLLAVVAFSFSLLGAFLVRSGVIDSVHAFASDPSRGVFLLLILAVFVGGALAFYAMRASELASGGLFATVSRESALLVNNALLAASLAAVLIGTIAPMVAQAFDARLTVGPPFFNSMLALFWAPLLALLPLGAATPWKRGDAMSVAKRLAPAMLAALATAVIAVIALAESAEFGALLLGFFGVLIGAWALFGAVSEPLDRARLGQTVRGGASFGAFWRRLRATPLSMVGKTLAHAGLGLFALGATLSNGLQTEDIRVAQVGDRIAHGGVEFVLESIRPTQGPNYSAVQAEVTVLEDGAPVANLLTEQRRFTIRRTVTTEIGLHSGFFRDYFVVLGEPRPDGGWALQTKVKPFASWIWFGVMAMAIGGVCSLLDRRLRVGAPQLRKAATAAGAALLLVLAAPLPAAAVIQPEEQFEDPAMEARARALFKELRCMTCDNQSVDDSGAPIAEDIRAYVRRAMAEGASDQEIVDRLVVAYGPDIRLSPPFWGGGFLVWVLPVVVLAGAATLVALRLRRRPAASEAPEREAPLTEEEQARLDALMKSES